jgi:hypothetical protein
MTIALSDQMHELEEGPAHAFRDWPATHFEPGPSGVHTVWNDSQFVDVGMSHIHRDDDNPKTSGVFGRLKTHALGRRSGDQFSIYICDRLVVPYLTSDQMDALARGARLLDTLTKQYIHKYLTYRVVVTTDGRAARTLEATIKRDGLPRSGRPLINP